MTTVTHENTAPASTFEEVVPNPPYEFGTSLPEVVGVDNAAKDVPPEIDGAPPKGVVARAKCLWNLEGVTQVATGQIDVDAFHAFIRLAKEALAALDPKAPTITATFNLSHTNGIWLVPPGPGQVGVANPLVRNLGKTSYFGLQAVIFKTLFGIPLADLESALAKLYERAGECVKEDTLFLPSTQWMKRWFKAMGLKLTPDEEHMGLMREVIFGVLLYPVYIQVTGYYPAMSNKRAPDFPLALVGSPWGLLAAFDKVTGAKGGKPSKLLPEVIQQIIKEAGEHYTAPKRPVKPLREATDESTHDRAKRLYTNVFLELHGTEDNRSDRILEAAAFCKDLTAAQIMEAHNLLKPPSAKKVRTPEDKARTAGRSFVTFLKKLDDPVAVNRVYAEVRTGVRALRKARRPDEAAEAPAKRPRLAEATESTQPMALD